MTGVALLVVAWLFIADLIFRTNQHLDYLRHHRAALEDLGWRPQYPVQGVVSSSALILAEAAVLWVVLTQLKKPFWIRTGATSLVVFVVSVVVGVTTWHTDSAPYEDFHLFWLFCMSVALALLCLGSGISQVVKRIRTERAG